MAVNRDVGKGRINDHAITGFDIGEWRFDVVLAASPAMNSAVMAAALPTAIFVTPLAVDLEDSRMRRVSWGDSRTRGCGLSGRSRGGAGNYEEQNSFT